MIIIKTPRLCSISVGRPIPLSVQRQIGRKLEKFLLKNYSIVCSTEVESDNY